MKYVLAAAATALLFAPAALATDISVGYSTDFEQTLEDDYGVREGAYLAKQIKQDLMREFEQAGMRMAPKWAA